MSRRARPAKRGRPTRPDADRPLDRVEGWNPVQMLLEHAPGRVTRVEVVAGTRGQRLQEIEALARRHGIPLVERDAREDEERRERIGAQIQPWQPLDLDALLTRIKDDPAPRVLALDGVTDQGNLGAILRSADFLGAAGVILPSDRAAQVTEATVRASQGAALFVDVVRVTNLVRALAQLQEAGFWVVGTALEDGGGFDAVPRDVPLVIVMGAEDKGIRRLVRERCDHLVGVPSRGRSQSMNVSVFAALALWELSRGGEDGRSS
jgi:23S rRNA (guanosine2251-2'-O)-methyltransferase